MEWNESLQKIRKQKGFSQQQIADYFITTQQQYSKYETKQQEMTVSRILDLCKLFNVSADQLLGINYYENEEGKTTSKYEELKKEFCNLIAWARYQGHITYDAETILLRNAHEIFETLNNK